MSLVFLFFFNDTATTEIYTLSLHDALPICVENPRARPRQDDVVHDLHSRLAAEDDPVIAAGQADAANGADSGLRRLPPRLVAEAVPPRRRRVAAALGAIALHHRRDERHDERRLVGLYVRHRVGGDRHPLLEDADVAADDEAELAQLLRPLHEVA